MPKVKYKVSDLSPHLFWEYEINKLEWRKDCKLIIHRVLELGLEEDWTILKSQYGINKIVEVSKTIASLDKISANYLATISDTDLYEFSCYRQRQYLPHYSGY